MSIKENPRFNTRKQLQEVLITEKFIKNKLGVAVNLLISYLQWNQEMMVNPVWNL